MIEHLEDDQGRVHQLAQFSFSLGGWGSTSRHAFELPGAWYFRRSPTAGWVLDPTHIREYRSVESLTSLISAAGLQVVACDVTPLRFPLSAAWALVRRVVHLDPFHREQQPNRANVTADSRLPYLGHPGAKLEGEDGQRNRLGGAGIRWMQRVRGISATGRATGRSTKTKQRNARPIASPRSTSPGWSHRCLVGMLTGLTTQFLYA